MRPGGGIPLEELVDDLRALAGPRARRIEEQYGPLSRYLFRTDQKERFHIVLRPTPNRRLPEVLVAACQGHSMPIPDELCYLRTLELEDVEGLGAVFYGTSYAVQAIIMKDPLGSRYLKPMERNHLPFYSTHQMAVRDMTKDHLRSRSREVCCHFQGIQEWIKMGHRLFIVPNGVILSGEGMPMVTMFEGKEVHLWTFSTSFPVIMKFAPRWHPTEDPNRRRPEEESWQRGARHGPSSSSSSHRGQRGEIPSQGRPKSKSAPRPSQAPSREIHHNDSDEEPLPPPPAPTGPRPIAAAGTNRLNVQGPID